MPKYLLVLLAALLTTAGVNVAAFNQTFMPAIIAPAQDGATATPTMTAINTSTATNAPTNTPTATATTPVGPTATTTPTPSVTPTATQTGTPTQTATPTATGTTTSTPTVTPTATATQVVNVTCDCSGNIYNCPSFATQPQAQACFDYCVGQGKGDVHQLDSDDDGIACEGLPSGFRVVR